jgi:prolipoprotein diacylglyceryltransferase
MIRFSEQRWIGNWTMSYPDVTDALNALFGTDWHLPIPTFGVIVAFAVVAATYVASRVVRSYEELGRMQAQSPSTVWDMAMVSTLAGIIGARVFDILDNADRFVCLPRVRRDKSRTWIGCSPMTDGGNPEMARIAM